MLLPLQGAPSLCLGKPRALPWAKCFWALAFPSAADFQFSPRMLIVSTSAADFQFSPRMLMQQLMAFDFLFDH